MKHYPSLTFNFDTYNIENLPNELKYKDLIQSKDKHLQAQGMCNELGYLSQGFRYVKGNNTLYFIYNSRVLYNKKVIYTRIVCSIRPPKSKIHRVRLAAGNNIVNY